MTLFAPTLPDSRSADSARAWTGESSVGLVFGEIGNFEFPVHISFRILRRGILSQVTAGLRAGIIVRPLHAGAVSAEATLDTTGYARC